MKSWKEEFPDRFKSEVAGLKDLGEDFKENLEDGKVTLQITIPKESTAFELNTDVTLKVIYPETYPFFRPEVLTKDLNLPRHQNPRERNLCLLARPTDNWTVTLTAADLIRQKLPIILDKGNITDQTIISKDKDEQAEPISAYYVGTNNIEVLIDCPINKYEDELSKTPNSKISIIGTLILKTKKITNWKPASPYSSKNFLRFVVKNWLIDDLEIHECSSTIDHDYNDKQLKVSWIRLESFPRLDYNQNLLDWLAQELNANNLKLPQYHSLNYQNQLINIYALSFPEEVDKGKMGWGLVFLIQIKRKVIRKNWEYASALIKATRIAREDYQVRIPQLSSLAGKKILVLGLGSLGAPAAIEFAKVGVEQLYLVDHDVADIGPSVRWPLGKEYSGLFKTHALKEFIEANYPYTSVEPKPHRIGTNFNSPSFSDKELIELIEKGEVDLVFDATVEEGVNHLASTYAHKSKIPYVCIEARAGMWGGLIFIDKVDGTACWFCMRNHLMEIKGRQPLQDPKGNIQAVGCGDKTFTGTSFDLANIYMQGVRSAISILTTGDNSYSELDYNFGKLNLVDSKGSSIIPTWEVETLDTHPECWICNG